MPILRERNCDGSGPSVDRLPSHREEFSTAHPCFDSQGNQRFQISSPCSLNAYPKPLGFFWREAALTGLARLWQRNLTNRILHNG